MICEPCREAGALNLARKDYPGSTSTWMEQQVILLHAECKGGTWCDCQHKTEGVNWLEVNRAHVS
jgi:hypothetical protein